jgi:hypothetical protein
MPFSKQMLHCMTPQNFAPLNVVSYVTKVTNVLKTTLSGDLSK